MNVLIVQGPEVVKATASLNVDLEEVRRQKEQMDLIEHNHEVTLFEKRLNETQLETRRLTHATKLPCKVATPAD